MGHRFKLFLLTWVIDLSCCYLLTDFLVFFTTSLSTHLQIYPLLLTVEISTFGVFSEATWLILVILARMLLGLSSLKIMSNRSAHLQICPPLQKLKKNRHLHLLCNHWDQFLPNLAGRVLV